MSKSYRSASRAIKKAGRKVSAGLFTAAVAAAAIPFRIEKKTIEATGDDGVVLTSLLFRASFSPKKEDSVDSKPTVRIDLRPMKEVGETLSDLADLVLPKKAEDLTPADFEDEEDAEDFAGDAKLEKEHARILSLEEKVERQRVKIEKHRVKIQKHRVKIQKRKRKLARRRAQEARK